MIRSIMIMLERMALNIQTKILCYEKLKYIFIQL